MAWQPALPGGACLPEMACVSAPLIPSDSSAVVAGFAWCLDPGTTTFCRAIALDFTCISSVARSGRVFQSESETLKVLARTMVQSLDEGEKAVSGYQ